LEHSRRLIKIADRKINKDLMKNFIEMHNSGNIIRIMCTNNKYISNYICRYKDSNAGISH